MSDKLTVDLLREGIEICERLRTILDTIKVRRYERYYPDYEEMDSWEINVHRGPQKKFEALLREHENTLLVHDDDGSG